LEEQLRGLKVELVLGRRVVGEELKTGKVEEGMKEFYLDDGSAVSGSSCLPSLLKLSSDEALVEAADFVFLAHGATPNTAFLLRFSSPSLPTAILNVDKRVIVKPTLQLASEGGELDHVFALGDIVDVPESKVRRLAFLSSPAIVDLC
jgi:thioredoxin reductase